MQPAPAPEPGLDSLAGDDARSIRLAWCLIAGITLFRMLYAALHTFDLAGDEAYYWDWGRRPAWGYYSKPPLIAWLMRLVTEVGGNHTLAIRLAAAVIGAGSLSFILLLAKQLFGNRAALWAVVLSIAVPANVFLAAMLTIDAPLVFFWSASLQLFWRWFEGRQPALSAALLAVTLGFGYLSKQMMLVFPVLAIVFLATRSNREKRRRSLRSPQFWLAIAASLCFVIPNLIWNARHDWIMFAHTGGQISGEGDIQPFGLTFLTFLGTQAGILSPLTWFLIMALALAGLRFFRRLGERERFLVIFSAPAFMVMYLMSLSRTMLPNWPAVYYVAALVLVAGWIADAASIPKIPAAWRKLGRPAAIIGLAMVALVHLLPLGLDAANLVGHQRLDPFRRVRGHRESAERAAAFLDQLPRPDKTFLMAQGHRYHASHFAFYLPGQPRVYRWEPWNRIASQYELWPNAIDDGLAGWDALVFVADRETTVPYRFEHSFESLRQLGEISVRVGPDYEKFYRVYLGESIERWPPPLRLEEKAAREAAKKAAANAEPKE